MSDLTNMQVQKTVQTGIGNLRSNLARLSGSLDNVQRNSQHIDEVLRSVQNLQKSLNNLAVRIDAVSGVGDHQRLTEIEQHMQSIDARLERMDEFCDNLYDYMQHRQQARMGG